MTLRHFHLRCYTWVSSRGMGHSKSNGVNYAGEDFMLATAADIAADPSAPDALSGIMEGKEWVWDNLTFKEREVELAYNRLS